MKKSEAFPSSYLGQDDIKNSGQESLRGTVVEHVQRNVPGDRGDEIKNIIVFREPYLKDWIINTTNWDIIEAGYGEDSDDWRGRPIELYVDPNIMFGKKRTGGVRARIPTTQQQAQAQPAPAQPTTQTPAIGKDSPLILMSKDEAIANCFDAGISRKSLGLHLTASGVDVAAPWDADICTPLVRQLVDATMRAKSQPTEQNTADLEKDLPF